MNQQRRGPANAGTTAEPDADTVRGVVVAEMRRRGVTVSALAAAAGIAQPHLSRWLNGGRSARVETAERVLVALGLVIVPRERVRP